MKFRNWIVLMCRVGFIFALSACEEKNDPTGESELRASMTDAPGPFDEVNVDIQGLEVHSDVNGWNTIPLANPGVYDLLKLTNGQIYDLKTPSGQQSEVKIQINKTLIPGITYDVTLDFDASKSIIETGKETYILKPVIRAITDAEDGIISGTLSPAMLAQIQVISTAGDTTGAYSDSLGAFQILGLTTGVYQVDILSPSPYSDTIFTGISVRNGQITSMGTLTIQ